jgi:hypothetical protein
VRAAAKYHLPQYIQQASGYIEQVKQASKWWQASGGKQASKQASKQVCIQQASGYIEQV